MTIAYDQSRELAAIDAATRVLDFCGQRNAFARKYSTLVKDLRQQLSKGLPTAVSDEASPSSAASRTTSQSSAPYNWGSSVEQSSTSTSPLTNADMSQGSASIGSLNAGLVPWSEQFGIFYPTDDISFYGKLVWLLYPMSYANLRKILPAYCKTLISRTFWMI